LAVSARRVGRHIYEQAVVKAKAGNSFLAGYFQTSIRHHPLGGGGVLARRREVPFNKRFIRLTRSFANETLHKDGCAGS
jgi:hypothetical protein